MCNNQNFFLGIIVVKGKRIRVRFQGENCRQVGLAAIIAAIKAAKQ